MNDNPYLDKFKELYESTKNYYDVPSFEEFVSDLQDSDKMFQLRESLEEHFDMPVFEDFLDDFGIKKKGQSEPEPSEPSFDSAGFIQQEETEAKAKLQKELAGKGYNVQETGVGDALSVTNTITGEKQEIDLQPIDWFRDTDYSQAEIEKVKKLVNTPTTPSESVLSILNQKDFIEDTDAYVEKLKSLYGNRFEIKKEGGKVVIRKGELEETFDVQKIIKQSSVAGGGTKSEPIEEGFYKINKFMLDNMNDEDVLAINDNISFDANKIQDAINNISTKINIDDETINGKLYSKDYFKTLFDRLESEGVNIPEEAKSKLMPGGNMAPVTLMDGVDGTIPQSSPLKPFNDEERQELINKYFTEEQRKRIESYDKSQKHKIKLGLIDRTKKLKTETYYENSPLRETNKAIIRLNAKNISEKELGIRATLFAAVNDHSKVLNEVKKSSVSLSEKYPGVEIKVVIDPETNQVSDIVSSEPIKEVEELRKTLQSSQKNLYDLYQKSDKDIDSINTELETTEQYLDAAERNYNLFDTVWSDVKVAGSEAAGSVAILSSVTKEGLEDLFGLPPIPMPGVVGLNIPTSMIRKDMADERDYLSKYRARKRTYEEAISEGRKTRFASRTVAEQSVNIGLAIATAGAGSSVGLSKAAISTLISSEFGLTSAGATYDSVTTRQEQGRLAKEELKELEKYKGKISEEEYFNYKYDLERASKDADISATEKTLAVVGTGLVEFGVSRFIGTGVNALNFTKNIKAPKTFLENIYRSNYKAALEGFKDIGKSTLGEIGEEVTIAVGGKFINYATMGDNLDFSDLDDIAVTSIITSGAMNVPGTSYGTFMTQVNSGRYKSLFEQKKKEIQSLKDLLSNEALSEQQRGNIHQRISSTIQETAGITTEMEADVVLMGAEDLKESLMLSNVKHQAMKKAGVKPEDTQEMVKAKIKNYIESLEKDDAKKYVDNLTYIDNKKKEIIGRLDYDNAIEKVFGEKGVEQAKKLDKSLTAKQKYTEVYKQFRETVNQKAKKDFQEKVNQKAKEDFQEKVIEKSQEKISDLLNRPVTITELGGAKLESPIEGDLYVEGQQVVIEDSDGNITELGNVDEISEKGLQDLGIKVQDESIKVTNKGNFEVDGEILVPKKEGIKRNKKGGISRVVLRTEDGSRTRTLRGAKAEDAAYQILLKEAQSPEQEQRINEILEKDEEFQNKLRETENTTKEDAVENTRQDTKTKKVETQVNEESTQEKLEDTEVKTPDSKSIRKKKLKDLFESTKPKKVEVQEQVDNALKAISEVAPDVEIIISDSEQDYLNKGGEEGKAGMYQQRRGKKVIYINPAKVNSRTVAHEIFHALLLSKGMSDKRARDITAKMMKAVAKSAPPGLQAYLNDFSKEYDSNIQNEEKLAELFGKLASEMNTLPDATKNIIKRWLDKLAKILGLKEFTDAEVIDLLNTVSGKVARGQVISKNDVSIFNQTGKEINESLDRFQASFSDIVSGITYEYDKNTEAFKKIASKYITRNKSLSDFDGKFVILHQPDMAFSGTIKNGDQLLVSGKGGVFYPIKFHEKGYFWASTEGAANDMAKSMNATIKANGGKIYLALTTAPRDKTLSSTNMSNGVLDLFMNLSKSPELNISETEMLNIAVDSYNKAFKDSEDFVEISKDDTRENILKKIRRTLGPTESSFKQRHAFSKKIIDDSANTIKNDKVASEYVYDIFGEGADTFDLIVKNSKGVSISASGLVRATTQLLTEPMLRNDKKADNSGKVYAVLEIDGEVEAVDAKEKDDHESYPKAIRSKSGNKTTLHLLKDRKDWKNTVIDPDTKKQVGDRKVLSNVPKKAKKGVMVDRYSQIMSPSAGVTLQAVEIDTVQRYQVEVSEARTLAEIGLENGFTESEIAEVAAEKGISPAEINLEIERIQEEKTIAGQKAEKMYTDQGVVKNFFNKAIKHLASGKGFLPKSGQVLKEWMNGSIEANAKQATQAVNDFIRATKKNTPEKLTETTKILDKYMRGDLTAFDSLPEEIKPIAKRMRVHIDTLTSLLISSGAISADASIDNIILNMGSYMARSYKVHDDKKYTPTDAVVNAAKQYLRKNSIKLQEQAREKAAESPGKSYELELEKLINENIKRLLVKDSSNDVSGFQGSAKVGSKKTKGLKQRLDLPKELRELMGEYESPILNYIRSIEKISNLVGNQVFLNGMKKAGEGVFLFSESTGKFDVQIASDNSKTMNPLDGMWTTKEIAKSMEKEQQINVSMIPGMTGFYRGWLKTVGVVKYSKTILSPATHAKNIIGNLYFMGMNGYTDPSEYRKAFGVIMNDLQGKSNVERRALLDEYIRAGIINQSATLGEINAMFDRTNPFTQTIESTIETEQKAVSLESLTNNKVTRGIKTIGKTMSSLYQAEDDMFKIIAYENEKSRYIKAKTNNSNFNNLSESDKAKEVENIKNMAAENVKNILPNYNRIGKLGKAMKQVPVAGTFISFTLEAMRTGYNTAALAVAEVKDPALRSIGLKRIAGILTIMGLKAAVIASMGIDDEDDEITAAARHSLPEWHKNSRIAIKSLKDGQMVYSSISDIDPHAFVDEALIAALREDNVTDAITEAVASTLEPFFARDILLSTAITLFSNETAYGSPVYNTDLGAVDSAKNIGGLVWKTIEPGGVKTMMKLYEAGTSEDGSFWNELRGQVTGVKDIKVDLVKQNGFTMRALKKRANATGKDYNTKHRNFYLGDKSVSVKDVEDAYILANEGYKKVMNEAGLAYERMLKLGLSQADIYNSMKAFNKEEKSAIFNGYVINKKWKN